LEQTVFHWIVTRTMEYWN